MITRLAQLSARELLFLRDEIKSRNPDRPVDEAWLMSFGRSHWAQACQILLSVPREVAVSILDELIECKQRRDSMLQLVWSGPLPEERKTRSTAVALRELFDLAEQEVLIAGYAFDHGEEIFAPLHKAMVERNVKAEMFIHVPQPERKHRKKIEPGNYVHARVRDMLAKNWPFGQPEPQIYYDARVTEKVFCSLHAKCAVVDQRHVLIGSANFTQRGQRRNVEAGVLIDDEPFAKTLVEHFRRLAGTGAFLRR